MQEMSQMRVCVKRPAVVGVILTVAAGLAVGGCASSTAKPSAANCSGRHAAAGQASGAAGGSAGSVAAGWALPGGNLANTRDVASSITCSDVSTLGVAWSVPLQSTGVRGSAGLGDGYATTAIVVNGVVYLQDLESNVMAIKLATGKVLWTRDYNSVNGGPDGVNVVNGVVYAATNEAAVALSAATGKQLWSRVLIGNDLESIDMAPGYNDGTVYVSTVPVSAKGEYLGGAKSTLWALNAATGAPEWSWDEVQDLWGNPGLNSGGGLWDPAVVRQPGQYLRRHREPGPDRPGWLAQGLPMGNQPSRPGPVHRLGRQAQPAREAAVVLPAHPARPF
jgi:glucose dehydrogenase